MLFIYLFIFINTRNVFLLFHTLPLKILLLCFWQQRVTCNRFLMQFNIGVILVMLHDLNTVIDKVIFWQEDRFLCPAKKTNILGSVTLAGRRKNPNMFIRSKQFFYNLKGWWIGVRHLGFSRFNLHVFLKLVLNSFL